MYYEKFIKITNINFMLQNLYVVSNDLLIYLVDVDKSTIPTNGQYIYIYIFMAPDHLFVLSM